MPLKSREFYCYTYLREDGTPYYVGKATGSQRPFARHRHVRVPRREHIILQRYETEQWANHCFVLCIPERRI